MELIQVRNCIEKIIVEIGKCRREIEEKGAAKAKTISNYDRRMASTLAVLRNSDTYVLDDKTYKQPPVSIAEKIAKGLCWQERLAMELAESGYKACISNLSALLAQVNAFQSILRYWDET